MNTPICYDDIEVPDSWTSEEERVNETGRLIAQNRETTAGEKITISPDKSNTGPGYPNAHRVKYWDDDATPTTVATGLSEAEHLGEAKQQAVQEMRQQ